jgi:predicted dehydrogenase
VSIGFALIGYGAVGRGTHAPLLSHTPGIRLHAILTSKGEAAAARYPDVRITADYAALLADPAVDAVVIATPNDTHADLACQALAAGKHVVVDKPLAPTLVEGDRIFAAAAAAGRLVTVFQNRRYDADFLCLRHLIQQGELGEVMEYHAHYDRLRPQVQDRWREWDRPGAGIWFDLGAHLADQALSLFGPPDSVLADLGRQRPGSPAVDYFHVQLLYGRLRVHLHGSSHAHDGSLRYRVLGTRGQWEKHGIDPQETQLKAGLLPGAAGWGQDSRPGILTRMEGETPVSTPTPGPAGNWGGFYQDVAAAIRRNMPLPVPPQEARLTLRILTLAEESSATGRRIHV